MKKFNWNPQVTTWTAIAIVVIAILGAGIVALVLELIAANTAIENMELDKKLFGLQHEQLLEEATRNRILANRYAGEVNKVKKELALQFAEKTALQKEKILLYEIIFFFVDRSE